MANLQKALQREIALFSEAVQSDGGSVPEVSKAAFRKARKNRAAQILRGMSQKVSCHADETAKIMPKIIATRWKSSICTIVDRL